ncbi:MAG: MgtC/SapB family protein [Planctomycetia bacterium]|nr:MgtC/SapB family protein [Planctomycetia bacterium]
MLAESMSMPDPTRLAFQLGLALLCGFLIGLQRERSKSHFGIRTFPLITVLGTLCAMLSTMFGLWLLPTGLFCLTLIGVATSVMNWQMSCRSASSQENAETTPIEFGTTTFVTLLVMYCVGALLANPEWNPLAIEITGVTAIILQFKIALHEVAGKLGESDMKAIMQFVMISFVILPLLPNRGFGPFDLFNPYETWLMVVLFLGMRFAGYIFYGFFWVKTGILLGGGLGGTK